MKIEILLKDFKRHPAASDATIADSEKKLGAAFPAEYVEFLKLGNGGEGFVGKNAYVMLWRVEELAPMNQAYEAEKYAPGLLIFGSDGGDEAFGFDTRGARWEVVRVPFVGTNWRSAQPMGKTFNAFLKRLYETA
jgi:hypothetical protein